ncbi:hypothetical protein SAMN04489841_0144 [Natrinema salaciae]|uniref:Uncharacterized protein n=2 Tax=Natrinema salaciae TaxID=1186196 RepID=A0A1H8ZE02_9EURY|nr:hypothetical protein SAMN04489841_0144 [Natrinema salaciae]
MSTVVDVASYGDDGDDGDDGSDGEVNRNPFGEATIEVDDDELRRISPGAWAGRVSDRLDDLGKRLIYGR